MTFKALLNYGGYHHDAPTPPAMDRYHGGGGHYDHGHGWHSKGKGGGGNGAALSALTLLAFLFLMNVMQQSLMENNATETTTATTIFLREDQQPISLTARQDGDKSVEKDTAESSVEKEVKKEKTYIKIMKPN
ncbi:hypothetical protein TSAR_000890 [Trichomalopsis sarcophagae]|uniref:Uncharacterized protein n=1 Tax=Trichomalopsis sarcophagae TaxID=543379 RepID=A0A232F724_9HYME|nr:hypothetical protein TSAR_000890 [Trichomalopsis sarcophagae]